MACCRELLDVADTIKNPGQVPEDDEPVPGPSRAINDFIWPANRRHPLLFPHILRDVLDHLVMKDVESCREVCRRWNDEACSVIQEKKIVALLEVDALKYYVQKMEATSSCPHAQFELHMENISEKNGIMKTFWTSFGSNIKFLDLHQTILFLENLFQLLGERLPSLERLSLRMLPRRSTRRNSHPPVPLLSSNQAILPELNGPHIFPNLREIGFGWFPQDDVASKSVIMELFQSMPNLEKVSLSAISAAVNVPRGEGNNSRIRASKLIQQVLTDPEVHLPLLTNIDFELETGNAELAALSRKGYQFRNLSLKLASDAKSSALKDFLSVISPNLKTLEIAFNVDFFNGGVTFPACSQMKPLEVAVHLKEVKELTLHNFRGSLSSIPNLDRLKKLTVNNASFDPCPTSYGFRSYDDGYALEKFQTDSITTPSVVTSISRWFPLLRVLCLKGINDDGLGVIYRNLPYLVELTVVNGKCTDQGISGVPLEVCIDMAETVTFKCVNPEKYRRDLFLGSLQYLKTLRMSSEDVSDVSIAFGIVDCKNLRDLTLCSPAITDTGLIKIADRMSKQLQRLDVTQCDNVTEEGKFYIKEKMVGVTVLIEAQCASSQRSRPVQNPNRQVGFPFRGRLPLPTERDAEFVNAMDQEYGIPPIPVRDRLIAMDRRRRLSFRLAGLRPLWYEHPHNLDNPLGRPHQPGYHPGAGFELVHDINEFMDSDDEEVNEMEAMELNEHQNGLALQDVVAAAVANDLFEPLPMDFLPPNYFDPVDLLPEEPAPGAE